MNEAVIFQIGDTVFHRVGPDRSEPGLVSGINFRPGHVTYLVTWGPEQETVYYAFELSNEPTFSGSGNLRR